MIKNKNIKLIITILLFITLMGVINMPVFASLTGDGIKSAGDAWIQQGASNNPISIGKISEILKPLANILLSIGLVVVTAVGIVIGIKYVTASPDSKGKLKGQLVGLVISGVVLAGSYGIWSIVYYIMKEITA